MDIISDLYIIQINKLYNIFKKYFFVIDKIRGSTINYKTIIFDKLLKHIKKTT